MLCRECRVYVNNYKSTIADVNSEKINDTTKIKIPDNLVQAILKSHQDTTEK